MILKISTRSCSTRIDIYLLFQKSDVDEERERMGWKEKEMWMIG